MNLTLYDSLTARVSRVEERDEGVLTAYICGPTVYSYLHVGNARPYWLGQVLKRFVEQRLGARMTVVANITDVNDKIYEAALKEGVPSAELAERFTQAYIEDTSRLGLGRPDLEPRVSSTVPQIITLIERLVERGLAYESGGDVYYRVGAFESYGALSKQRTESLIEGARVETGEQKESPLDFALWKAQKAGEDSAWDSPWGRGRPGWHIECSAMAREHLGPGFDLHGGGLDLVFPHHENERAQSEGAYDEPFARRWVHNAMLRFAAEKMSKSLGNVERLRDALDAHSATTLCMFFARAKYRSPVDYDDGTLGQARAAADTLREALRNARRYSVSGDSGTDAAIDAAAQAASAAFDAAMSDDLDTPAALAVLHGLARDLNVAATSGRAKAEAVGRAADVLVACLDVLGLAGLDEGGGRAESAPPEVRALVTARVEARAARDFARADELRDRLAALGWTVRDTPQGPEPERL